MGLKDILAKFKDEVEDDVYDEEVEGIEEEEEEETPALQSSTFRPGRAKTSYAAPKNNSNVQMMIIEPTSYEGVEKITDALRDLRPVVINFENTDSHDAARIVDFVSGTAYALDGKLKKIGKDIFLCVPKNVTINCNEKNAFSDLPENVISNWKESNV